MEKSEEMEKSQNTEKLQKCEGPMYFNCSQCGLKENYHYYGKEPKFSKHLKLKEDSYIMKDPFSVSSSGDFLLLGSRCSICDTSVCCSSECSIFYTKRFCLKCATKYYKEFPTQIQTRIKI